MTRQHTISEKNLNLGIGKKWYKRQYASNEKENTEHGILLKRVHKRIIFLRLLYTYIIISRSLIVTDCCHEQNNCYGLVETKLKMLLEMVLLKKAF